MPIIEPGSKVLVTGANGYIATWLTRTLLEQGRYAVRGTVRSQEKGAHLLEMFKSYGDKFELIIVEDSTKAGAFDKAVVGIDSIAHIAAPSAVKYDFKDPKEVIDPAVGNAVGILESAKNASNVKRIIILGSGAAILHIDTKPLLLNENDWNEQCLEELEKVGKDASVGLVYMATKTLAEKAVWSFYRKNEKEVSWDMAVISAPYVVGPTLCPLSSPAELNVTLKLWYNAVVAPNSSGKTNEELVAMGNSWVDVRDFVAALSKAVSIPEVGGERIMISAGGFTWQEWIDVANSLSPSPIPSHAPGTPKALPTGNLGAGKSVPYMFLYDTAKEKHFFGLKFRTKEEVARDILADFEERGW